MLVGFFDKGKQISPSVLLITYLKRTETMCVHKQLQNLRMEIYILPGEQINYSDEHKVLGTKCLNILLRHKQIR